MSPNEIDAATERLAEEMEHSEARLKQPEESAAAARQLERMAQRAAIRRDDAEAEALRTKSRNLRKQTDADTADREEWTKANIKDQRKRTDADIEDRQEMTRAEIADHRRRTGAAIRRADAEVSGLVRSDRTTDVERYFWMGIVALGVLSTILLAVLAAGHSAWEFRVSPVAGLLLSSGGGLRLWSIAKRIPATGEKVDERRKFGGPGAIARIGRPIREDA